MVCRARSRRSSPRSPGTNAPRVIARRRWPTPTSFARCINSLLNTTMRRKSTSNCRTERACTGSRAPTSNPPSTRGSERADAASSCSRPAPARPTSRRWPSTTSGGARWWWPPRSIWCASGTTCCARRSACRWGWSAAASTTSRRSPSPPTTPPISTWSTSARASGSWCSTSVITSRARRMRCRRGCVSRPIDSGSPPRPTRLARTRPRTRPRMGGATPISSS